MTKAYQKAKIEQGISDLGCKKKKSSKATASATATALHKNTAFTEYFTISGLSIIQLVVVLVDCQA